MRQHKYRAWHKTERKMYEDVIETTQEEAHNERTQAQGMGQNE
jgi:hypothetical protein